LYKRNDFRMNKQVKIIVVVIFLLLGAALLSYGAICHKEGITIPDKKDNAKVIKTEPAFIKLVSIGGLKRDESGNIKQTFGEQEEAPKACPT
jgi:hypothetical protein